ncbi:ubiquitin-conjugating enzyme [Hamiltosporidium tvaerminnensis]|uniref:Ubiquitin-conjugating enzyme n=2 Tax=Hamiltosporidium TaxID=1176354 RepID=A0A4Q9LG62_9MICR|nr:Ubiquitin-conjugating enzyme E2 G2 [Hamiltosporidium tvaerminnensis]TBU00608.1 ubiquitin-conjugating enzyme [Hamiltosporidium tvaerminnensis]TBU02497.1 ubiquitin-conjugating enzyme [Hamiltosporidium magnivora]TBU07069.1 ubiquitin-conjugating enzyme [Hamiltosporidium magnivora]TBU10473.1 ubiquitin-conjugating enzyme [Hamiltosporidium tvaerminnensis]
MASKKLNDTALRRLMAEEKNLKNDFHTLGFIAMPRKQEDIKDYSHWDIYIQGQKDTLYEGCLLHALIEFHPEYPIQPPKMKFISKMFHPNIYSDGKVCISILHMADDDPTSYMKADEKWTPVHGIRTIVHSVVSLLNEPNTSSPANVDASKMFNNNIEEYKRIVRNLAKQESIEE